MDVTSTLQAEQYPLFRNESLSELVIAVPVGKATNTTCAGLFFLALYDSANNNFEDFAFLSDSER